MGLNVELLEKVKKHILAEPKRVDMGEWVYRKSDEDGGPACGTVGCIAGWAVLLSSPKQSWKKVIKKTGTIRERAIRILGLDEDVDFSADELFCWESDEPTGTAEYAKAVAEHIDEFIAEHR